MPESGPSRTLGSVLGWVQGWHVVWVQAPRHCELGLRGQAASAAQSGRKAGCMAPTLTAVLLGWWVFRRPKTETAAPHTSCV